jgi:hypothetical protein
MAHSQETRNTEQQVDMLPSLDNEELERVETYIAMPEAVVAYDLSQQIEDDFKGIYSRHNPNTLRKTIVLEEKIHGLSRLRAIIPDYRSASELENTVKVWSSFVEKLPNSEQELVDLFLFFTKAREQYPDTLNAVKPFPRKDAAEKRDFLRSIKLIDFFLTTLFFHPLFNAQLLPAHFNKDFLLQAKPDKTIVFILDMYKFALSSRFVKNLLKEDQEEVETNNHQRLEIKLIDVLLESIVADEDERKKLETLKENLLSGQASNFELQLQANGPYQLPSTERPDTVCFNQVSIMYYQKTGDGSIQRQKTTLKESKLSKSLKEDVVEKFAAIMDVSKSGRAFGRGNIITIGHDSSLNKPIITEEIPDKETRYHYPATPVFTLQQRAELRRRVTNLEEEIARKRTTEQFLAEQLSQVQILDSESNTTFTVEQPIPANDEKRQLLRIEIEKYQLNSHNRIQFLLGSAEELDMTLVACGHNGLLQFHTDRFSFDNNFQNYPYTDVEYRVFSIGTQLIIMVGDYEVYEPIERWDGQDLDRAHLLFGTPEKLSQSQRYDVRLLATFIEEATDQESTKQAALAAIDEIMRVFSEDRLTHNQFRQLIQTIISYYQNTYGEMLLDQSFLMTELVAESESKQKKKATQVTKDIEQKRMNNDLKRFIHYITENSGISTQTDTEDNFTTLVLDSAHQRALIELFTIFENNPEDLKKYLQQVVVDIVNQNHKREVTVTGDFNVVEKAVQKAMRGQRKVTSFVTSKLRKAIYTNKPFGDMAWKIDTAFNKHVMQKIDNKDNNDGSYSDQILFADLHITRILSMAEAYWNQKRIALANASNRKNRQIQAEKRLSQEQGRVGLGQNQEQESSPLRSSSSLSNHHPNQNNRQSKNLIRKNYFS